MNTYELLIKGEFFEIFVEEIEVYLKRKFDYIYMKYFKTFKEKKRMLNMKKKYRKYIYQFYEKLDIMNTASLYGFNDMFEMGIDIEEISAIGMDEFETQIVDFLLINFEDFDNFLRNLYPDKYLKNIEIIKKIYELVVNNEI
jgi:hypothetical protein